MNKKLEWCIIIFLVVILTGLSACSPKRMFVDKQPPHETEQEMHDDITKDMDQADADGNKEETTGVQNIPNIVEALTCMFSPDTCEAVKQEQKMDR